MLTIKRTSFKIKVFISFLILGLILLSILFLLIVPKMQEEKYNLATSQMQKMIKITKEQVIIAGKAITVQSKLETSETKYKIFNQLLILKNKISLEKEINDFTIKNIIRKNFFIKECKINIIKPTTNTKLNTWEKQYINKSSNFIKRKSLYTIIIDIKEREIALYTSCDSSIFNKNHSKFEEDIKSNIQKSFNINATMHKGKSYLIWINKKYQHDENPLYNSNELLRKDKYTISNMSNIKNILTTTLSAKDIIASSHKKPLSHLLNNKEALTWVSILSTSEKYFFILLTTAYKKDLYHNVDSTFWKILPASLLALFIAIFIGFFIFQRLFKGINLLSKTAIEINKGNLKIRSSVKGNDDIGNLGITFDAMLDSIEENINTLDLKVENKTKELQDTIEEKDLLLKEIHHRVKNNLALTISLIKLQQAKIKDAKTINILNDIQERIYTMELVHRKLYESKNLNLIEINSYIKILVNDISRTYEKKKRTTLKFDIDDIYLDIEKTIPCALILNEIITNAFKYAFVDNKNLILEISMKKTNNEYILKIKDNGKGIPSNIDIYKTSTLGLKLINSISKLQLKGSFEYKYEKGAIFIIRFKN
jgi:two-component sensor histidine kinase